MRYTNVYMQNSWGYDCALHNQFPNVIKLRDAIEDSDNIEDLIKQVSLLSRCNWILSRATDSYIRLEYTDSCRSIDYLYIILK